MGLGASEVPTSNELFYLIVKVIAVLRVMAVILVAGDLKETEKEASGVPEALEAGPTLGARLAMEGLVVEQSLVSGWGLEEVFSSVEDGVEIGPLKLRERSVYVASTFDLESGVNFGENRLAYPRSIDSLVPKPNSHVLHQGLRQ
ncbi:hypothetical protein B296_00028868 [Ensete ventricosum]|uniref:Uncharacterized protein n=1 Tax=Ensete ventricosum TaxID=4639 RepID=A0A427A1Z2_ENSVE|nr:hypothetical protein B296_00028868 [Ensete ventricosum]